MNSELVRLLHAAGVPGDLDWRKMLVLYNYAPVPAPRVQRDRVHWNRGFNLVILSHGRPEYFAKCRPTDDAVLEWETEIRSCLAGDRPRGVSVTPVCAASSERLTVQVSPFLRGPHYGRIVPQQSTQTYVETLRQVLVGAASLADLALHECPRVRRDHSTIPLAEASTDVLATVAGLAALDEHERGALETALVGAGEVPARPQHGDFWWQNLVMVDGQLWAIDFDSYGDIQVALYDDMTLILTTIGLRAGGTVEGLERLGSANEDSRACHELLVERATAEGMSASQLTGVLVYYLINMAATVHRRGGPGFSTPHIAAVRRAAERLAAGTPLLVQG